MMQHISERRKTTLKQGRMLSDEVDDSNMTDIIQYLVKSFQTECERACVIVSESRFKQSFLLYNCIATNFLLLFLQNLIQQNLVIMAIHSLIHNPFQQSRVSSSSSNTDQPDSSSVLQPFLYSFNQQFHSLLVILGEASAHFLYRFTHELGITRTTGFSPDTTFYIRSRTCATHPSFLPSSPL